MAFDQNPPPSALRGMDSLFGYGQYSVVRELNEADLVAFGEGVRFPDGGGGLAQGGGVIKSLKQSHHSVAKLMAAGHRDVQIAAITGYSQSRLSVLKHAPAFQELIAFYRESSTAEFVNAQARVAGLALDTIEELHERLVESPEDFTNKELLEMAEVMMDRSIAPPKGAKGGVATTNGGTPNITISFVKADAVTGVTIEGKAEGVSESTDVTVLDLDSPEGGR
jgi:hypothetical protein